MQESAHCLNARDYKGIGRFKMTAVMEIIPSAGIINPQGRLRKKVMISETAPTLRSQSHGNEPEVVIPVITPDKIEKRQNGRRFKEDGDPAFTLTAQDRHGVAISVKGAEMAAVSIKPLGGIYTSTSDDYNRGILDGVSRTLKSENHDSSVALGILRDVRSEYGKEIRKEYEAGDLDISRHEFLEKEISENGTTNTLTGVTKDNYLAVRVAEGEKDKEHPDLYVDLYENCTVYAVWYEKYGCYIAIRKLTPRECFRLQGWTDEYFDRAAFVNSDSQLYKQAGNGVTVNVVYQIGKRLAECEKRKK